MKRQEKVQSKCGSSPLERVSGNLSSVDAFIGKKVSDVAIKEAQLAALRSELSAARSHKEVLSDVFKHLEQESSSLPTLWKLSNLDIVDIWNVASKDGKSETSTSICTQTENSQFTPICTQTETSQFTSTCTLNEMFPFISIRTQT